MTTSDKISVLKQLGDLRKKYCYENYFNLSYFHNGLYESEFVSPYSKSSCNVNSPLVILLQDWSSSNSLSNPFDKETAELGFTPSLPTNRNLNTLLKETFNLKIEDVFITNVFPFIKKGGLSSYLPIKDINKAFSEFCLAQIKIINPKLVICCGSKVFHSAINHFKLQKQKNIQLLKDSKLGQLHFVTNVTLVLQQLIRLEASKQQSLIGNV